MENKNFVHLHRHDSNSLLDGLYNPEKYAKYASEIGILLAEKILKEKTNEDLDRKLVDKFIDHLSEEASE